MCKKFIYLISFVVVLSLAGNVSAQDPNLVAYYTFDGDANDTGTVAPATNGTLQGNPAWTAGRVGIGGSIDLDGDADFVQIPDANKLDITRNLTVAFWMRVDDFGSPWQTVVIKGDAWNNNVWKFEQLGSAAVGTGRLIFVVGGEGSGFPTSNGTVQVDDGLWHHVAGVYDGTTAVQTLYVDGVQDINGATVDPLPIPFNDLDLHVSLVKDGFYVDGGFDDLRIYNRALAASEIWDLYNIPFVLAHFPSPGAGEIGVPDTAMLSWTAGDYAVKHDVYFGTDETAVKNASDPNTLPGRGRQDANSYDPTIALGQDHYWRIDEVNSAGIPEWPGVIWSFASASYDPTNPSPADGYQYAPLDTVLRWTAGYGSARHKVFFGTTYPPPYVVEVLGADDPNYDPPGDLTESQTYYWQIYAFDGPDGTKAGPQWSFRVTNGLRGHWKFDDGDGNTPDDSSGNNNFANFGVSPNSLPTWTSGGRIDGALEFDGDEDWVDVMHDPNFDITESMTVAVWIKINDFGGDLQSIIGKYDNWKFERAADSTILWCIEGGAPYNTWGTTNIDDGEFHHLVGVYDGATGEQRLYVDGVEEDMQYDTPHAIPASTNPLYIGSDGLDCVIDDLRVYDYNLSAAEIWDMWNIPWLYAHNANPASKSTVAMELHKMLTLSWAGGTYATSHDVYFGTDFDDVNDANILDPEFKVNQAGMTYGVGPLETETTYYWRIDELGDPNGPYKGYTWYFTTADSFIVDDFESYADTAALKLTWLESAGNGNRVLWDGDPNMVHGGTQSMKVTYNSGFEVYRTIIEPDLAGLGMKALDLWFYGDVTNSAQQMYVKLKDGAANTATVLYDGDTDDVNEAEWHVWRIDLADFSDGGVVLSNVSTLTIGFSAGIATSDVVYFDDIELHPSRCIPEYVTTSLNDDCVVDGNDLDIMMGDWLLSEYDVNAVTPSANDLVAHYEFDGDLLDSSMPAYNGDPNGDLGYAAGKIGSNSIDLDGVGDYVIITGSNTLGGPFDINDTITVACWIKVAAFDKDWQTIIAKGDSAWRLARDNETDDALQFFCSGLLMDGVRGNIKVDDGLWHHVAGVYDGSKLFLYVDGIIDVSEDSSGTINNTTSNVYIGENEAQMGREWNGQIDEVRIYNRALSHGEIVSLAGESQVLQPLPRPKVDLYEDGKVNFRDYSILANSWLEETLWP